LALAGVVSQGCKPTLGFKPESRWDSKPGLFVLSPQRAYFQEIAALLLET
jgi:hypothetical protein